MTATKRDGFGEAAHHAELVLSQWEKLSTLKKEHAEHNRPIIVNGTSLDIATTTAAGRYGIPGEMTSDPKVRDAIQRSVRFLEHHMAEGNTVYGKSQICVVEYVRYAKLLGINTGFGGSADVRCSSNDMHTLQRSLLQHLNCGVLCTGSNGHSNFLSTGGNTMSLPEEWVRATMVVRANSLARGHSAVRMQVIEGLLNLLNHNLIPVVPLRGSISASGDLCPLSYIAGALEGNPDIFIWTGPQDSRHIIPASEALRLIGLEPVVFEPKEGLGLVNGTAVCCAVASLTLHSVHNLFVLGQILTATGVETMLGTATSFAPFISAIRPHPGQQEVAGNISSFLTGSQLAAGVGSTHDHSVSGLYQDRYSLRTVPQWLGPFLEDIQLAHQQVSIELNSTTDNPLIDAYSSTVYHGGNFQAVAVTSAMEKTRLTLQAIGRLLFSQCTELLNPKTNRGLPPSLCADEPSLSFTLKGLDTSMASYMSELSFLANPVHNHVVSAEMGNQAINSLALISARYTDTTVELVGLMSAAYIYALCQALDLRAMLRTFERSLFATVQKTIIAWVQKHAPGVRFDVEALNGVVSKHLSSGLRDSTTMDTKERFLHILTSLIGPLSIFVDTPSNFAQPLTPEQTKTLLSNLPMVAMGLAKESEKLYRDVREQYLKDGDASALLGRASRRLYQFVRNDLGVPMNRGIVDHPTPTSYSGTGTPKSHSANGTNGMVNGTGVKYGDTGDNAWRKKTIGHWVSRIYEAIRDERLIGRVVIECLKESLAEQESVQE